MQVDLNIIGHLVLDDKEFINLGPPNAEASVLGGPPAYSTMVIPLFSNKTRIITAIGQDFPEAYLHYLSSIKNLELKILECKNSTRFLHQIYSDRRVLFLLSQADHLDSFLGKQKGAKACLISPVFSEISASGMDWVKENHEFIGIDIQGFVRNIDKNNKIILEFDSGAVKSIIKRVNMVKFSLDEAQSFTQKKSFTEIFDYLPKSTTNLITLGTQGVIFNIKNTIFKMRAPTKKEADPTGAGDVLMTGIMCGFLDSNDIEYSIAYGMALAAEKVHYNRIQMLPQKEYNLIAEKILDSKESKF